VLIAGVNHFRVMLGAVSWGAVVGCFVREIWRLQALSDLSLKLTIIVSQAQNKGNCHEY
jgi:hypothetical protein